VTKEKSIRECFVSWSWTIIAIRMLNQSNGLLKKRQQFIRMKFAQKKIFRLPHTLVLLYALVIIVYLMSLVIPSGQFQRVEKDFK
jgi:hypothetical protein